MGKEILQMILYKYKAVIRGKHKPEIAGEFRQNAVVVVVVVFAVVVVVVVTKVVALQICVRSRSTDRV